MHLAMSGNIFNDMTEIVGRGGGTYNWQTKEGLPHNVAKVAIILGVLALVIWAIKYLTKVGKEFEAEEAEKEAKRVEREAEEKAEMKKRLAAAVSRGSKKQE